MTKNRLETILVEIASAWASQGSDRSRQVPHRGNMISRFSKKSSGFTIRPLRYVHWLRKLQSLTSRCRSHLWPNNFRSPSPPLCFFLGYKGVLLDPLRDGGFVQKVTKEVWGNGVKKHVPFQHPLQVAFRFRAGQLQD